MTIGGRDVSVWGENDLDRWFVGRRGGVKGIDNGRRYEHGNVVDGHDEGITVLSTDILYTRHSGVGEDNRGKTAFPVVTLFDLESKEGVLASNGRGQVVEAFERVVGDFQVEEGEIQTIRVDDAVIGEKLQEFDVEIQFVEVVHSLVKSRVRSGLDGRAAKVKVVHYLQGAGVSEEDAEARGS
jgi:hypothetical protein